MKTGKKTFAVVAVCAFLYCFKLSAFETLGKNESYLGSRFLTFSFGMGVSGIKGYDTVSSNGANFSLELDMGHEFSQSFSLDFSYKFGLVGLHSPNPLDTSQRFGSTFTFSSEAFRLFYNFPRFSIQPYVYAGIGVYSFGSVDSKTAMSFPFNLEVPVGAGVNWRIYKDKLALRAGFDWHILLDENQKVEVLNLLNADKVSFDLYSVMLTLTWYLF